MLSGGSIKDRKIVFVFSGVRICDKSGLLALNVWICNSSEVD